MVARKPLPRTRKTGGRRAEQAAPSLLAELRRKIVERRIPPGAKLLENELAAQFGVSRGKVREALSALEQNGLIQRIPNRGAVVARLDLSSVFHIYDVREVLEGLAVRLATLNVPPESWQDLLDRFAGPMPQLLESRDFEAYIAGYDEFRQRVIEAAENPVLARMLDTIYGQTQAIIRRLIVLPDRAVQGLAQHRDTLAAMRRGDAAEAERLRRESIRSARAHLERFQSFVL